jgi:CheY-like chemotaxis protein
MKILVVEDNEAVRDLLARLLQRIGYVPVLTSHGKEGLEKAIAEKPNLIIMDMIMPIRTVGKQREPFAPIPTQRIFRFWQPPRCFVLMN